MDMRKGREKEWIWEKREREKKNGWDEKERDDWKERIKIYKRVKKKKWKERKEI